MLKNCKIYETLNPVAELKVNRSKSDGLMRLTGVFGICGVKNNNNRIYEMSNYASMVKKLQENIKTEGCPGELEHPKSMNITLENISHKIESIDIDDKGVISGTIALLNTPKGLIAQAIVEGGLPLFISSRGQGNVDKNTGRVELSELKTYDLVGSPGFSQARLNLMENQVVESINESVYYTYNQDEETENENNDKNIECTIMDRELLMKVESLERQVRYMSEQLEDRDQDIARLTDGIQNWFVNEMTPVLEQWITTEAAPAIVTEKNGEFADAIQNWVMDEVVSEIKNYENERLLEGIQNWFINEMTPVLEQWVTDEYSAGLQEWIVEEFTPNIEKWITEEYSSGLQEWIVEHLAPAFDGWVTNQIKEARTEKLSMNQLDNLLTTLEESVQTSTGKPLYSRKSLITEGLNNEPLYIRSIPPDKKVEWDLASEDVKESVRRKAKLYNLNTPTNIQNFWESVDFKSMKPSATVYEGLNVVDQREQAIRAALRRKQ